MSQQGLADSLTKTGAGSYDRSIVQKMTVARKVTAEEAQAIAAITGHPLPDTSSEDTYYHDYQQLSAEGKAAVQALIRALLPASGSGKP
ncbi:hypothetical protein E3D03_014555 [Paracoccus sp. DMF]|nr:hypothetical protein [Paracoccus sp. DMF]